MLTADLVDARRKDGELLLRMLDEDGHEEALTLARNFLDATKELIGKRREELDEAWDSASTEEHTSRFKLAAGLKKLIADECTFEAESGVSPTDLRRVLFTYASEVRKGLADGEHFDREAVIREAATRVSMDPEALERGIFSDLKAEHLLRAAPTLDPASVVEAWELGQAQAVLLAATEVRVEVMNASAGLARAFFAKLKFHKLLFSTKPLKAGAHGFEIVIDGPYSMFDSVTKYGVRLACLVPALRALESWKLEAKIKWGKTKDNLVFKLASTDTIPFVRGRPKKPVLDSRGPQSDGSPSSWSDGIHLSDDVRELIEGIQELQTNWKVRPANMLLEVPGDQSICIPDLELTHPEREGPVYVEVMGYWSRDAVWKRVELVEAGLEAHVVFVVSSRLRVSAEVLDDETPSALYVYKGKMSPRAVLDRAEALLPKTKEPTSKKPLSTKKKKRATTSTKK